ncbi:MAG: hypothetical protein HKP03_10915 [Xanthomonadales bacterium]|nr:hypothetical protein [Gammaproteobacteria bacterium]NNK38981.1 hypothetical protein [Xanthomonadales bacterium]
MRSILSGLIGLWLVGALGFSPGAIAAEPGSGEGDSSAYSLDELAIELINPIGSLASLDNAFRYETYQGDLLEAGSQTKGTYTITPTIPFRLSNGRNLVIRTAIPVSFATPTYVTEDREHADWLIRQRADTLPRDEIFIDGHGHLEDIRYDIAYGGVNDNGLLTMFGLAGVFPTSQDGSIERDQYLLGPQVAVGKITDWGIFGAWAKHLVSVADVSNTFEPIDYDTSETSLRLFFAYGLGNGWQIISNPEIIYDWEGASDNKLLLPLGGGISKTVRMGRLPMKMDLEIYGYLESPEAFGTDWMMTFRFTPLLPNWFHR